MAGLSYFSRLARSESAPGPTLEPAHPLLRRWQLAQASEPAKPLARLPLAGARPRRGSNSSPDEPTPALPHPRASRPLPAPGADESRPGRNAAKPPSVVDLADTLAVRQPPAFAIRSPVSTPTPVVESGSKKASGVSEPSPGEEGITPPPRPLQEAAASKPALTPPRSAEPRLAEAPGAPARRNEAGFASLAGLAVDDPPAASRLEPLLKPPRRVENPAPKPSSDAVAQSETNAAPMPAKPAWPDTAQPPRPPMLEPKPPLMRAEPAARRNGGVRIGSIDIRIEPPPTQPQPRPALPQPQATAPLARGFASRFGLRQG